MRASEVSRREEQADDLIDERDRLQRTVVHLTAAQVESTPSRGMSATPTEKSVKLKTNSDHYDTEAIRIAYVENRVGGKAAKHLRRRLRVDAVTPYTTAEEMLKHLETIF
jgi:hypothetical protein